MLFSIIHIAAGVACYSNITDLISVVLFFRVFVVWICSTVMFQIQLRRFKLQHAPVDFVEFWVSYPYRWPGNVTFILKHIFVPI